MHWGGGWGVPGDRSRKGRMREVKKEEMGRKEKGKRCMCVWGGVHITHLCGLSSVLPFGSFLPDTPRPIQMIQKW